MSLITSIMGACGKPIHVSFSNRNVTAAAIAPFLGSFIRSNPLFGLFLQYVNLFSARDFNPFNHYTSFQLLFTRTLLGLLGRPNPDDVLNARQDPLIRETLGEIPSPATLCREETLIGRLCERERSIKLKRRRKKIKELPKYDRDVIGSSLFGALNESMLFDKLSRIPKKVKYLVLDCDSTFIRVGGSQDGACYCAKNRAKGYFPLLCFLNNELVHIQNAPGATDGRRLLEQCLERLVTTINIKFPETPLVLRTDAGFNSREIIDICDRHGVYYVMGFGGNAPVVGKVCERIRSRFTGPFTAFVNGLPGKLCKVVWPDNDDFKFGEPPEPLPRPMALCGKVEGYRARDWTGEREIYYRIQINPQYDVDFRFVQTNIPPKLIGFFCKGLGTSKAYCNPGDCAEKTTVAKNAIDLYYGLYCERGNCELDIKRFKETRVGTRLSAHSFFANWYRLMLAALVQHLFNALKEAAFSKLNELAQWRRASFGRFLDDLVNLPATIKYGAKRLLVSVAYMDRWRRGAFEAIVNSSY